MNAMSTCQVWMANANHNALEVRKDMTTDCIDQPLRFQERSVDGRQSLSGRLYRAFARFFFAILIGV
jgi:hypothetical protein